MSKKKTFAQKIVTQIHKNSWDMEISDLMEISKKVKECIDLKRRLGEKSPEILTSEERDLFLAMSNFFIEEKLNKDSDDISKYMNYAQTIGEIAGMGNKYTDNIRFFDVKDKIRKYIEELKESCYRMRNKVLNNCP